RQKQADGKQRHQVFYQDRFVGYMDIDPYASIKDIPGQRTSEPVSARVPLNTGQQQPMFSQLRTQGRQQKNKEIKGSISLSTHLSNGQEAYGEQENNVYDLYGQMEVPILGMAFQLDGFYTSQDKGRVAKASYFHWHYDANEAKSTLMALISSYRDRYQQSSSSLGVFEQIYVTPIGQIKGDQSLLWTQMSSVASIDMQGFKKDTSGLYQAMVSQAIKSADSLNKEVGEGALSKLPDYEQGVMKRYHLAADTYAKIQALNERLEHYEGLLEGYGQRQYYDSLLAYDDLRDLDDVTMSSQ